MSGWKYKQSFAGKNQCAHWFLPEKDFRHAAQRSLPWFQGGTPQKPRSERSGERFLILISVRRGLHTKQEVV